MRSSEEFQQFLNTRAVIQQVLNERLRQQRLIREGHIQFACESPLTSDGDRLAVLVEEVGEVARAMMEGRAGLIEELIQVAAVAVACAEGVVAEHEQALEEAVRRAA